METRNIEMAERITQVRKKFCNGNNMVFAQKLGMATANTSSYCKGQKNAGKKFINSLLQTFPQVNAEWLLRGEGDMLRPDPKASSEVVTEEAPIAIQDNGDILIPDNLYDRFLSLIESQNKQIESRDRQIDRLITLLENKYSSHSQG